MCFFEFLFVRLWYRVSDVLDLSLVIKWFGFWPHVTHVIVLTFKEIKHLSDYRTVGLSDHRTIGLSDYRTVGLSDCRIIGRTPKTLSTALIQCHFDYACSAWYAGLCKKYKDKLQVLQNKAIRYIKNMGNRISVDQNIFSSIGFFKYRKQSETT